ncbi:carbohydrate-binding protein [Tengunoibacter tsumagoiensis]|uniref:CBM6 domain-containing protein n=1 Tax=Tengunoibacter tsumagoiensis TaxID=2014871 RepID=A0A401ZV49_9CHLR|nr:carbohydrate-binding protein [Tengunoibacter tsumagoiensis]GCE10610.1 hypothetical protein KTT_04690 [Tengunoibacter tsumagoiensis]
MVHGFKRPLLRSNWSKKRMIRTSLSFGSLFLLLSVVLASFSFQLLTNGVAHAETPSQRPAIGINLGEPDPGSFTDAMKTSGDLLSTDGHTLVAVDSNGWPTADFQFYLWQGQSRTDGTYQVIFNGQADLSVSLGYATFSNQQYNAATNTTTVTMVVTTADNINFYLYFNNTKRTASSATNTGITGLKFFKPVSEGSTTSYDPSVIFTPYVAQAVAPYTYIRFMFGTNWNKSTTWSDRTTVDYATQHKMLPGENGFEGNQMAFEYMVKIANDNNKDLYIVVPDRANNDYITKLAQLLLYGSDGVNPYTSPQANPVWAPLKPSLKLYVEYTNEAWNFSFDQAHDLYDGPIGAQQEIANNPNSPLIFDGNTDGNLIWHRNYANRSLNVSNIFRSVFGDASMGSRVRPLLYWQYNNLNNTAQDELEFINDYYNNADGIQHVANPHPVNYYFWGGGGAVYFNSNNDGATSVDSLFASGVPQSSYQSMVSNEGTWARSYGLHFMSYEGSWGISGSVGDAGRVDPRAQQALLTSFNDFVQAGGENYTAGTFGQWDDFTIANTYPLVKGAAQINASDYSLPSVTLGTAISASGTTTIPGTAYDLTISGYDGAKSDVGQNVSYLIRIGNSDTYQVYLSVANDADGGKINVYADSELLTTVAVPNTGSKSSYQVVSAGTVTLSSGLHSLFLRPSANASNGTAGNVDALYVQPSSVSGTPATRPAPNGVPSYLQDLDIGGPALPGSVNTDNGTFTINASGYDIWNNIDAFHYVYEPVTGDTTIIARVTSLSHSSAYAKAGVMIRKSLDGTAANAASLFSNEPSTYFEDRLTDNGNTNHPPSVFANVPYWVKLVRTGDTFTGYGSTDGSNWTLMGSDTIVMGSTVYVGLALTSHNDGTLASATFDNVSVNGTAWTGSGTGGSGSTPTPTPTSTPTPTPTPIPTSTPTPTPTPSPTSTPTPTPTPSPTATPSPTPVPTGWTACAKEGGTCTFSGTQVVRYGANGHYNYQTATNSIKCNNGAFGDPINGTKKTCDVAPIPPTSWTKCADENGTCAVTGTVSVAYGANGKFIYKTESSNTACNNSTFTDPIVGTVKACYYK